MAALDDKPLVFRDFSAGLWERGNDRECPPNGLLALLDAYPLPAGGLRAGPRWQVYTETNLPTTAKVTGLNVSRAQGVRNIHLLMEGTTVAPRQVWLAFSATTGWSLTTLTTNEASTLGFWNFTPMVPFTESTGGVFFSQVYFGFPHSYTTVQGMWSVGNNSTAFARETSTVFPYYLTNHMNRLVCVESTGTYLETLRYTNAASDVFTTGTLTVQSADDILSLVPYFPNDLNLVKRNSMFSVQGDIVNPLVRETSPRGTQYRSWACKSPMGVVVMTRFDGVFVSDGGGWTNITPNFVGSPMVFDFTTDCAGNVQNGQVFHYQNFLFTPKFYCFDLRTKAWFRMSFPDPGSGDAFVAFAFFGSDPGTGQVFAAHNTSGNLPRVVYTEASEGNMTRATSFSFTLPVIDLDLRNARVRRIEVHAYGFNSVGTISVSLTPTPNAGQPTASPTTVASGLSVINFDTSVNASTVKISVTSASNAAGVEAPMIERVNVWLEPKQRRA